MKIYYCACDNGDGSMGVEFFDNPKSIELLEEYIPEYYRSDGGSSFEAESFSLEVETLEMTIQNLIDCEYTDRQDITEFLSGL